MADPRFRLKSRTSRRHCKATDVVFHFRFFVVFRAAAGTKSSHPMSGNNSLNAIAGDRRLIGKQVGKVIEFIVDINIFIFDAVQPVPECPDGLIEHREQLPVSFSGFHRFQERFECGVGIGHGKLFQIFDDLCCLALSVGFIAR